MLRNKFWDLFLRKTASDIVCIFLLMAGGNNSLFEDGQFTAYFKEAGISFFVIGATARNIIMHNESSGRLTYDLDIAITLNDCE